MADLKLGASAIDSVYLGASQVDKIYKGSTLVWPGYSAEAQAVFNRMTGLTTQEKNAIAAYVDAEVLNGNWALTDEFYCFKLATEANSLIGWKSKTAVNTGAVHGPNGFRFDGADDFINTNFNLAADGVNYTRNSALMGGYFYQNNSISTEYKFGAGQSTPVTSLAQIRTAAGGSGLNTGTGMTFPDFDDDNVYYIARESSSNVKYYSNGVGSSNIASNSIATIVNLNVYVGARNLNGVSNSHAKCIIGAFLIGGAVGFNHSAHNTNLRTLLTSLSGGTEIYTEDHLTINEWIAATRDKYALKIVTTNLYWSDNGRNDYVRSIAFADAQKIEMAYIFGNGNLLFATGNKIYKSTDGLVSYSEITVKDTNNSDYVPHVPADANYPGSYFTMLNTPNSTGSGATEMIVWTNYGNVYYGANPTNVYYSPDAGVTVKIAYKFGQNPSHRDDGTIDGGSTGTLLGDSGNAIICRHGHSCRYNAYNGKWYFCTGDDTDGDESTRETHWFSGTYDSGLDAWSWVKEISSDNNTRYKACGIVFEGAYVYWGSDENGGGTNEKGIWKSHINNLFTDTSAHTQLFNDANTEGIECTDLWLDTDSDILIATWFDASRREMFLLLRKDGSEFAWVDLDNWLVNITPVKDADRYFRLSRHYVNYPQATTAFVRIGTDGNLL